MAYSILRKKTVWVPDVLRLGLESYKFYPICSKAVRAKRLSVFIHPGYTGKPLNSDSIFFFCFHDGYFILASSFNHDYKL